MSLKEFKKKKPKEEKLWQYRTEHVDTMLWQYGCGLVDAYRESEKATGFPFPCNTVDNFLKERFAHLEKVYHVRPSFHLHIETTDGKTVTLVKTQL